VCKVSGYLSSVCRLGRYPSLVGSDGTAVYQIVPRLSRCISTSWRTVQGHMTLPGQAIVRLSDS